MPLRRRGSPPSSAAAAMRPPPKISRRRSRYSKPLRNRRNKALGSNLTGRRPLLTDEEYLNYMTALRLKNEGNALSVTSINFNKSDNCKAHHTTEYEINDLVIRRGMPFDIKVSFDHNINVHVDLITLQLSVGSRPQESKGTLICLKLDLKSQSKVTATPNSWSAHVKSIKNEELSVEILPPSFSIVGKYQLCIESNLTGSEKGFKRFEYEDEDIIVIFNPWCADDVVFMSNEDEREEYVLNDHGRIWVGSAVSHSGRPWNFGQFENPCLEAALHLLDKAELLDSARRSPISIVRAISALANSNDDDGVLEGRWTEKYPKNSTPPTAWTGSVAILQEFMAKDKPVQYGQCWVFSGIVTTLCRALGIPTRSVTNFESAHDNDSSMTIDFHFSEDGKPLPDFNDSVWNFHVWNESWFRRPDLPDGYDGWQAHDATPQEISEGVLRCGPAPLTAIKEGHVYLNYDIPFIFSEVNGDKIQWKIGKNGEMDVISIDEHAIGKYVSTKAVGSNDRLDLTHLYKYPDGSAEERKVVEFVNKFSTRACEDIYCKRPEDVTFELILPANTQIGKDVILTLNMKNTTEDKRAIKGRITLMSSYYTGVPAKQIDGQSYDVELDGLEEKKVELQVTSTEYLSKLNPEASFLVYSSFTVTSTGQNFAVSRAFSLTKPVLEIIIPAQKIEEDKDYKAKATFTNPLEVNLTNGVMHIEGAFVVSTRPHEFKKPIKPGEKVTFEFTLKARRTGIREIQATFTSDQLSGVNGSVEFEVIRNIQPMDTE